MKKLLAIVCMMFGFTLAANASGGVKSTSGNKVVKLDKKVAVVAEKRANHLSDMMIRELGLNNYQSRKMREINQDVVARKMAIESEFAGNQSVIDQKCKEVCSERDQMLENVLSTKQYNKYFGHRKAYNDTEQEFMASLDGNNAQNQTASAGNAAENNTVSLN